MNYIRQCRLFVVLFMMLCLGLISFQTQAATKAKPKAAQKERLVLMPLRLGAEDQQLQGAMEMALVKGLQQKYEVFFGEQVAKKAREIFMKESRNTAKKECDETRCLQGIAEAFQAELLATANITKQKDGYFIALSVQNLFDNKVVQSESVACKGCDAYAVVDKLKELVGAPASESAQTGQSSTTIAQPVKINLPAVPVAPRVKGMADDADSQSWVEVVKGNTAEDYKMYLESFPQGKYAKQAAEQKKKLEDYAKAKADADAAQAELSSWNTAMQRDTEIAYIDYLKQYPTGPHAVLARIKGKKAKEAEDAAVAKAREEAPKLILKDIETNMVAIPGKNYELGKYEVMQKEWQAVMGNNPGNFTSCGDNCPVEQVSWNDSQEFLQKLNAKTGKQYRLPTEAEWEYACYGGVGGLFSSPDYCGGGDIDAVAWYIGNSKDATHPVGQKRANNYGLYDMSGNVWEWMQDESNGGRALRGGSWNYGSLFVRAANRFSDFPTFRSNYYGFRLARTLQ